MQFAAVGLRPQNVLTGLVLEPPNQGQLHVLFIVFLSVMVRLIPGEKNCNDALPFLVALSILASILRSLG